VQWKNPKWGDGPGPTANKNQEADLPISPRRRLQTAPPFAAHGAPAVAAPLYAQPLSSDGGLTFFFADFFLAFVPDGDDDVDEADEGDPPGMVSGGGSGALFGPFFATFLVAVELNGLVELPAGPVRPAAAIARVRARKLVVVGADDEEFFGAAFVVPFAVLLVAVLPLGVVGFALRFGAVAAV
jgi:hypothetical protein